MALKRVAMACVAGALGLATVPMAIAQDTAGALNGSTTMDDSMHSPSESDMSIYESHTLDQGSGEVDTVRSEGILTCRRELSGSARIACVKGFQEEAAMVKGSADSSTPSATGTSTPTTAPTSTSAPASSPTTGTTTSGEQMTEEWWRTNCATYFGASSTICLDLASPSATVSRESLQHLRRLFESWLTVMERRLVSQETQSPAAPAGYGGPDTSAPLPDDTDTTPASTAPGSTIGQEREDLRKQAWAACQDRSPRTRTTCMDDFMNQQEQ